ncbi:MAG: S8 family serine peptidase [Proteobacteria bacterium]|nr:S8 family serine peptidase [Pseudomonadota bacterium]
MKFAALVLLVASLAGCAAGPALSPIATLPAGALARPDDYLVVTIKNPIVPAPLRAASTPRGYDGAGSYRAGGAARAAGHSLASEYGLVEVSRWPISLLGVDCLVYGLPAGSDVPHMLLTLQHDRRVESVQRLQAFGTQTASYNDPYSQLQKNVAQMDIPEAQLLSRGKGVRVAVIDTGADVGHPDFRARAAKSRNFVDSDAVGFLADTHGTAVAGVIGAVPNNGVGIVGIAPDAELLVYKACWRAALSGAPAVCNTFTLAQALAAAIDAHADIINLSLGGPSDPLLTRLIKRGLENGAIIVGAVPRGGERHGFPVEIDGVIAADGVDGSRAAPGIVRAPGRDVLSLAPEGHYDFFSGSSLAAAEVSGVLALLRAERPQLTSQQGGQLLETSSRAAGVNACAALTALLHRGQCPAALAPLAATAVAAGGRH